MFGVDWNDSSTFELNVLNAALGILCLLCYVPLAWLIVSHLWDKRKKFKG